MPRDLAYTTVMTTVRILQRKKFIKQCGKRGRAFMYKPVVTKKMVRESMSKELANRLFDGSLKLLMLDLVQHDGLSADALAEIRRAVEQQSETDTGECCQMTFITSASAAVRDPHFCLRLPSLISVRSSWWSKVTCNTLSGCLILR
jgi:BlaI family penicillinase repressor